MKNHLQPFLQSQRLQRRRFTGFPQVLSTSPAYGEYEDYTSADPQKSISGPQLLHYILGECATVEDVKNAIAGIKIFGIDPRASTVHWRFTEPGDFTPPSRFIRAAFFQSSTIRCTDLPKIDSGEVKYTVNPLDDTLEEKIVMVWP